MVSVCGSTMQSFIFHLSLQKLQKHQKLESLFWWVLQKVTPKNDAEWYDIIILGLGFIIFTRGTKGNQSIFLMLLGALNLVFPSLKIRYPSDRNWPNCVIVHITSTTWSRPTFRSENKEILVCFFLASPGFPSKSEQAWTHSTFIRTNHSGIIPSIFLP